MVRQSEPIPCCSPSTLSSSMDFLDPNAHFICAPQRRCHGVFCLLLRVSEGSEGENNCGQLSLSGGSGLGVIWVVRQFGGFSLQV